MEYVDKVPIPSFHYPYSVGKEGKRSTRSRVPYLPTTKKEANSHHNNETIT